MAIDMSDKSVMTAAKSRKGVFFTLIAISLLGMVLFSYGVTYSYSLQEKAAILETRVDTMNRFLQSVDTDMENAVYISGYRSIVALTDYVVTNGTYVADTEAAMVELFLNGTVEGYDSVFMVNNTFPDWVVKMGVKGEEVGINFSMDVDTVSVYQTGPWSVRFEVDASLLVSDQKATANWTMDKGVFSDVSIIDFEDPWYALHTSGMVLKRINPTIYDGNFSPENDTANLRAHVAGTYYIAFNASPSFLQRFENDYASHTYGIESLVNKTEIFNYCSLSVSSVDNICWRQNSTIDTWSVDGMNDTNFKIDNETNDAGIGRLERYGLEDVIYGG
ncbi:hypothetical protein KY362_00450 [Candidatus Woesearchaeota archaeon]|nr:hypothetical protein [Candidatus Woesearchaeota archaeon]